MIIQFYSLPHLTTPSLDLIVPFSKKEKRNERIKRNYREEIELLLPKRNYTYRIIIMLNVPSFEVSCCIRVSVLLRRVAFELLASLLLLVKDRDRNVDGSKPRGRWKRKEERRKKERKKGNETRSNSVRKISTPALNNDAMDHGEPLLAR